MTGTSETSASACSSHIELSELTYRFSTSFPLELESRISPAKFTAFIEEINVHLREAYSVSGAVMDNLLAIATWWTSLMWHTSHFEKVW